MKNIKSLLAVLLCLAMMLSLAACDKDPHPTDASTTSPAPAETTVSTQDYKALYAGAKAAALALGDVELKVNCEVTNHVGLDTFTSNTSQTILYHGLGTDDFTAQVSEDALYGPKTVTAQYYFSDKTGYTTCAGASFRTDMTSQEFCDLFAPVVLLDENLYSEVTSEETKKGQVLTFTGADTLESWMSSPDMVPQSITGTATLDENGTLKETTYTAQYTLAGTDMEYTVKARIKTPKEIPDMASVLSRLDQDSLEIPSLTLPALLEQAKGDIVSATSISSNLQTSAVSAAGDLMANFNSTYEIFGSGDSYSFHLEHNNSVSDFAGNSQTFTFDESFKDGLYTYTEKDKEPESASGLSASDLQLSMQDSLIRYLPTLSMLESMQMETTNTNLLISYTLNEEGDKVWRENVCRELFDDTRLLDEMASDYQLTELSGYLSIDLLSGLPVALSSRYSGTHTIDGQSYVLGEAHTESLFLGSNTSYEAIHGEPMKEEKPAETATPLFYRVTGKDGEEMWLLGTIHVGDSRTAFLPQEIYNALDASDALAVEFDIQQFDENIAQDPELAMEIMESYYYTDGTKLADHVDSDLYKSAITALKATGNYDLMGSAELMRPSVAGMMLDNYVTRQGYRLSPDKGVDNRLLTRAKAKGLTILDVESAEDQFEMMKDFSEDLQALLLSGSLEANPFENHAATVELYELWCKGDEAALIKAINEEAASEEMTEEERKLFDEYQHAMGTDRNDDMLDVAEDYLESGDTVFYAVGLAHLLAEDGLVNTLRDAGYTVELVSYQ